MAKGNPNIVSITKHARFSATRQPRRESRSLGALLRWAKQRMASWPVDRLKRAQSRPDMPSYIVAAATAILLMRDDPKHALAESADSAPPTQPVHHTFEAQPAVRLTEAEMESLERAARN